MMNTFWPFRNKKPSGLRTLASIFVLLMLLMAMPGPLKASAQPLEQSGWVQQWADEFNGTGGVNTGNWIYDTGTSYPGGPGNWGTGEVQSYSSSTSNVFQSGGSLNIRALHSGGDPIAGWTSGRIETQRADFQPPAGGQMAVEARVQLPNVSGAAAQGYWPAFWMLGVGYRGNYWNWPGIGEIDILENINGANQWWGTLHCGTSPGGPCNETTGLGGNTAGFSPSLQTAYHTYRIEYDRSVSPEQIRWYVDGIQRHIVYSNQVDATTWNNATNHGFFILFNVAIGGGWPGNPTGSTASGGTMLVDYVRVFYASSGGPSPTPTIPPVSEPYLGSPVSLPGTIQAENFDFGGEGVAFHETTGGNQGGYAYRTDQANSGNVDIANNCNVCVNYVAPSEWLRYAVSVATAGNYTFNIRHAGPGGGVFHVETTTGVNLTGPITQANTGSWDAYVTSSQAVSLPAGNYGIRLVFDSCAACNLNNVDWISFTGGPTITLTPSRTPTPTQPPGGGLPSPWQHQDVGAVGLAGNATYSSGSFTIDGGGADIWGAADEFHYVYQTLTGDGTVTARVVSLENTNGWAKAGVMIRESLASNSKHAMMVLTPSNGLSFQRRTTTGGTSASTSGGAASAPRWVRMVRSGSAFTAYSSTDGVNWTTVGSASITMGSSVTIGLAVTAHNDATLATAVFDNVSVTGGGPTPTFTPTPTNTPFTGGEYTQGVTAIDSANARIWFHSNVNSAWVDVHYTINGGAQLNYRMTFNSATGNWEQNVSGLTPGGVLYYFFTYEKGGAATDTQWFQYIVPSGPTPTSTSTPTRTPTIPPGGNVYQAETASFGGGVTIDSSNAGFLGTGYANFPLSGGYLQFNGVNGGTGGNATLRIRYALGATTSRTGLLIVNGASQNVTFNPTGAWTTWTTQDVTVPLNSGTTNTLRFQSNGQDLANIDQIEIILGSGGGPTLTPTTPPGVTCTSTGPTGTFPMCFQNNTGGTYADSQIYVTILGMASPGQWYYLKADGTATHINYADTTAPGHLTKNGINYPNMSFSLAQTKKVTVPTRWEGGRAYISLGSPMYIPVSPDNMGWGGPDLHNPNDPNADVYYDWYEFTYAYGAIPFGGNTTQVDQFSFPMTARLQQASSGYDQTVGITLSRSQVRSQYLSYVGPAFDPLQNTYRIIAPRSSNNFAPGGSQANYMQAYIDQTWNYYTANQFTLTRLNQTFTGRVSGTTLTFTKDGAGPFVLQKPTTKDVVECSGALASPGMSTTALELGAEFCAAFNRGVAMNTALWWGSPTAYYPAGGIKNDYAGFFHTIGLQGRAYGFPYDDINDQSSVKILGNSNPPSAVIIGIGW